MPIPVLTIKQMREWEQATWATGISEALVIQQVGRRLAKRILELTEPGDRILLIAGKGHNGDDARAAEPHLVNRNILTINATDAGIALKELQALLTQSPRLIVDALFGIGLDRPLDAGWSELVKAINDSALPVIAVDVPSGLSAETGQPEGPSVRASLTLTIGAPKAGLMAPTAAHYVGRLEVLNDVGLIPCYHHSELLWTLPEDFTSFPPERPVDVHKGSFGHLSIVAGSLGFQGAAVLAARAAQRARPGLITLQTQEQVFPMVAGQLQGVMTRPWTATKLDSANALLIGPGLAGTDADTELQQLVRRLWTKDCLQPMIADATAIDWLPMGTTVPHQLRVVTPHPGEAARMLNSNAAQVQADRFSALRRISSRFGDCWVVLKGHHTLIGRSSGEVYINPSGNPGLAQGGSGDVLAGYLAGLLVQPALQEDALTTLRYAVWQHGAAADALESSRFNWVVEDLVDRIGTMTCPTGRPNSLKFAS